MDDGIPSERSQMGYMIERNCRTGLKSGASKRFLHRDLAKFVREETIGHMGTSGAWMERKHDCMGGEET